MEEEKKRLLRILKDLSYEEGDFTLASGKKSTFYIDCKETTLNPEGMYLVGHLMYNKVREIPGAEAIGGVSIGGDPLVCATVMVSFAAQDPIAGFLIRKEPKGHGKNLWIEGGKNLKKGHGCRYPRGRGHYRWFFAQSNRHSRKGRVHGKRTRCPS